MRGARRLIGRLAPVVVAAGAAAAAGPALSPARVPVRGRRSTHAAVRELTTETLGPGRRGGTLTALDETDFETLDPGRSYYSLDYEVVYATQRPLYSDRPNTLQPSPDLAEGAPVISADAKTVTVHIKKGIRFSPPVNREVTSADVAYAIERGANPHVANPYLQAYFGAIEGMPAADGGPVAGILTPNPHEIVFRLTEPKAAIVAAALQLPLTAPVPRSYAQRFDRRDPSDYADYEVATGPYMLADSRHGKVLGVGYRPGRFALLVRNPNWRRATDFRPAYLNRILIKIGFSPGGPIGRRVLHGRNVVEGEPPSASTINEFYEHAPSRVEIDPGAGDHYIGINNKVGPFANIDLRKALWAALDRKGLDLARGGPVEPVAASHFLYPTIPGFEQAGGLTGPKGPQFDFDEHPEGDLQLAASYMRLAGYPSGLYTGSEAVTVVGAHGEPAEEQAEMVNSALEELGFKTDLKLVETSVMYARYCNVPAKEIDVCPNVGWIADFGDPQTVLDVTFNGRFIEPSGNVNWGQTDDPAIDEAMAAAETVVGEQARAEAWAKIDLELVEDAAAIPYDWEGQANVEGRGVHGVGDVWDVGAWDYSWTWLD